MSYLFSFLILLVLFPIYEFLYILITHTTGVSVSKNMPLLLEYGSTGSVDHLLGSHLYKIYDLNGLDFIFGLAFDPNGTDIGYVKLFFHVGLLGLLIITSLYLFLFVNIRSMEYKYASDSDFVILRRFFLFFIILSFVINYKSLELYSRGSFELLIIIYYVLVKFYKGVNVCFKPIFD